MLNAVAILAATANVSLTEETAARSSVEETKGLSVNHLKTFTVPKQRALQTRRVVRSFSIALLLMVFSNLTFAQVESGSVTGTVTDQTSAVIAGATVKVKNLATNATRITQTSAIGNYTVVGLEPATYEVK